MMHSRPKYWNAYLGMFFGLRYDKAALETTL